MNGNNSQSKEAFARSQAHPRKVELAKILLGTDENKVQLALDSGFNETIIQEMARDISKNVQGMETFAADLKNGVVAETEESVEEVTEENKVDEANETTEEQPIENNENQVPTTESTVAADQNPTPETVAPTTPEATPETPVDPEQSTPDQANPTA